MGAQRGKDLLLKVDTTGQGVFATVAGLRTRTLTFNAQTVDVTNTESANRWRELLSGTGTRHARLHGTGVFKDQASDEIVRSYFFNSTIVAWQIVIPAFGTVTGPFQVATLEFAGQHDKEVTFDLTLESAGEITFAPAPAGP